MRLTLRTLLAYLDDTLDANEIKEIGQKVAESDAAQELIARLKQVTRRRRLTVPPASGPDGTDPNDVAEYLDNELSSDRVSDLEKLAIESDVHLAEIAACHQILTLVLGEPALVPPKAKERMYGLVQGREAIPYRKAQNPKKADKEAIVDEESLAMSSGWLRWVLPVACLLLVGLLVVAVYQVIPPSRPRGPSTADNGKVAEEGKTGEQQGDRKPDAEGSSTTTNGKKTDSGTSTTGTGSSGTASGTPGGSTSGDSGKQGQGTPSGSGTNTPPGNTPPPPGTVVRVAAPAKGRTPVASYMGGIAEMPTVLVTKEEGKEGWQKVASGGVVQTNDTLIALPGFTSYVRSRSGVGVILRGHLRDFTIAPIQDLLMDSAVVLHPPGDFDLDMTLLRGRIFLANRKDKGPCKIRLRFETEAWDLTLGGPGDEVAVDLTKTFSPVINYRNGEDPRADCHLALLRGEAEFKIDAFHTYNLEVEAPKWARLEWDNFTRTRGPFREDRLPPSWSKSPPSPDTLPENRRALLKRTQAALKDLEVLLGSRKAIDIALRETLEKPDPMARMLAIYGLTAIDKIETVIESLGDEDPTHAPDREAAFYSLQRWVSRSGKQAKLLYDEKTGTGLLIDKKYRKSEATTVYQLLHPLLAEDLGKLETYEALARSLQNRKVAIAELGYWHLVWLSGGVQLPAGFNAAQPLEEREKYGMKILAMIEKGQLPPKAPMGSGTDR